MAVYQSFPGRPGASQSEKKLAAIRMPRDLTGYRVLDLGCNEGFFCQEAKRRGAASVLGVDRNRKHIPNAQRLAKEAGLDIEFRHGDMMNVPEGEFDLVLLLSAIHYLADPAELLARIRRVLSPRGRLILELGIVSGEGRSVGRALRSRNEEIFPTLGLLRDVWLRGFAFRLMGPSVPQSGDPIPRSVYHCRRERTSVVMIYGGGNIGKSSLARRLGPAPVVSTDRLLRPARAPNVPIPPAQAIIDAKIKEKRSLDLVWKELRNDAAVRSYCAEFIADAIRHCRGTGTVLVEGHLLADIGAEVEEKLGPEFRCWNTTRGAPNDIPEDDTGDDLQPED